jgi:hypothetical protein
MTYYRVDRRLFKVGDEIATASEYYGKFDDIAKEVEDALEASRPMTKMRRPECLFLFEDEKCARKHWSKMKDGKLYEVSIDRAEVLHRGDMVKMDVMKRARESGQDMSEVADAYWRGEHGPSPEIEIMVARAVVTRVLSTSDAERKEHLVKRWKGLA